LLNATPALAGLAAFAHLATGQWEARDNRQERIKIRSKPAFALWSPRMPKGQRLTNRVETGVALSKQSRAKGAEAKIFYKII
jgi:hypothetical protein